MLAGVGTALVAFYLTWVSYYVEFPADILMFAEGDFVNEIVKFRTGHPLYTAQQNNESMTTRRAHRCVPMLWHWACGAPDSIPVYRLIQLIYSLGGGRCGRAVTVRLMQLSGTKRFAEDRGLWGAIALPLFFLIATNSITNPFVAQPAQRFPGPIRRRRGLLAAPRLRRDEAPTAAGLDGLDPRAGLPGQAKPRHLGSSVLRLPLVLRFAAFRASLGRLWHRVREPGCRLCRLLLPSGGNHSGTGLSS